VKENNLAEMSIRVAIFAATVVVPSSESVAEPRSPQCHAVSLSKDGIILSVRLWVLSHGRRGQIHGT